MSGPTGDAPRGRSPGAILATLLAILLLCAGAVVWDQTNQDRSASPSATGKTVPVPQSPSQSPSPDNSGFGSVK